MTDDTPITCLRSIVWVGVAGITLAFVLILVVNIVHGLLVAAGWL